MKVSIAGGASAAGVRLRGLLEESGAGVREAKQIGEVCDLLICPVSVPAQRAACTILLLGDGVPAPRGVAARCAVSCGLSDRDTMTVSGLRNGKAALSLQREMVSLRGEIVEQREFVVPAAGTDARLLVLAAAALLCLGTDPERLPKELEKLGC